jgi:cob(I)alamin adenosyltransferase
MAITTKKGDKGMTSLLWGTRVSKDDIRVEIYGSLDELCSFLGLARSLIAEKKTKKLIESIQEDLFVIGSEIASEPKFINRLEKRIDAEDVKRLEAILEELEKKKTFEACCFYIPGRNFVSSTLDVCRTITRRAERKVVTFKRAGKLKNPQILIYLNRLSDLLFLLARAFEERHKKLPRTLQPI